jgi:hypothetical protein
MTKIPTEEQWQDLRDNGRHIESWWAEFLSNLPTQIRDDLTPQQLAGYRVLFFCGARCMYKQMWSHARDADGVATDVDVDFIVALRDELKAFKDERK